MNYSLFISCPKGLEYLLEEELKNLGLSVTRVSPQGVYGEATLAVVYHLCLWSRIANRLQLILFNGNASNEQALNKLCANFPWQTVFSPDKTIAVEFHGSSARIRNTMYGAQLVKDGIVDHFRQLNISRPTVNKDNPQIRLHAYLKNEQLTVSFDLTGYSLHQRGYRSKTGVAPLKENVAAALLMRAKWPELAAKGYAFHDPFCGSGTLVIEAAMMAAHIAPGLLRQDQSLRYWSQHQPGLWEKLRSHALSQVKPVKIKLLGSDSNSKLIAAAFKNAERAGVLPLVDFKTQSIQECRATQVKGLLACNPPYGERMGEITQWVPLYQQLGAVLNKHYQNWQAAILTSSSLLAKAIGLQSKKQYTLFNGPLECKLYCFDVRATNQLQGVDSKKLSSGAEMFINRLKKNYAHLSKWARKNRINCYRVYDADLPEYAFAIDIYNDYVVLQEYKAPAMVAAHKAEKRGLEVIQSIPAVLGIEADKIIVKQRQQQKGRDQYQKLNQTRRTMIVGEGQAKLKVNLYDYLDTGLFLDHRLLRLRFSRLDAGTRFLNCFCYTATASVHAALAGAITTNVDMSKTYLSWARDNFKLNELDVSQHQFVQSDCLEWLKSCRERFDVIFLDPPSFSNSKRMTQSFDIQRDHIRLIDATMKLLNPRGMLYFSTNLRKFKLSPALEQRYDVKNITAETIDVDFRRSKRIHQCYLLSRLSDGSSVT
ncbi:bifunctional 23S rRNA (guanine(2069)-N(7))-methyltransferase RlmK/23S rRNA (guanine(2445)-N(2))-methyltransferase RlmL [Legionella israelensis]|uniref:Ribosomal RNA large subunit methyltransferase K/L n=1 Tax=Legionella israelensis TaxID=454 RepID=A0AAX1ED54_9GAMM|nr:bifunctional 23S rRNA (guanine(2069)-N(7))-methyltransferase RlmK/23S rRNA (guanine(2445)-N(2))-methyltransferase RlmL [Legionella israelensis]QBR83056.1 bifunctional 23S rRNA (guanine(2069)-N(7))-methyltransferase RlmK/23S rRNA (guanine(2445)-N(2))-methyltransferase RlmL [Legionella israelensis]